LKIDRSGNFEKVSERFEAAKMT